MSAGDQAAHPVREAEAREFDQLAAEPTFAAAVHAYTKTDESHDVPDLGGSDKGGTTVFFDRAFAQAVRAGAVKYDGKPFDPRPFIHLHEAVEGAAIRLKTFDYAKAHLLATVAERRAVEKAGMDFDKYQAALKPWIRRDEHEAVKNPPPNLLLEPYKGPGESTDNPQYRKLAAAAPKTDRDGDEALPAQKFEHTAVKYGLGKPKGDHCAVCEHFQAAAQGGKPHCELVADPISPMGWCQKFEAADEDEMAGKTDEGSRADQMMDARMGMPEGSPAEERQDAADAEHPRVHALSIASANHLHQAGHISAEDRDSIEKKARAALNARRGAAEPDEAPKKGKPYVFGRLAP